MNSIFKLLVCVTTTAVAFSCEAAEVVLREKATQHGSLIRLGDVADISAASSTEVHGLSSTPLFPAPAKGTQQFLTVAKVRDLLTARGIDISQLSISGSLLVEIGESHQTLVEPIEKRIVKQSEQPPADVELLIKKAIKSRLQQTTIASDWRVDVPLTKRQLTDLATLGADVVAIEVQPLRSGRIRFQLVSDTLKQPQRVIAELTKIQTVVVAKRPIERGQLVRAVDVEVREREGNLPSGLLTDLSQAIGKVAQRSFRPDDVMLQSFLRAAWQVRRGETVNAYVRTGNIVVRTRAVAKQNGAMGELITVETLGDKQRLDVTVSGPSEVTVYATGGRATDFASLDRPTQRR